MKKEVLVEDISKLDHKLDALYEDIKKYDFPTQGLKRYNALAEFRGHLRDELNDILAVEQTQEAAEYFVNNMSNLVWASDYQDDDDF